VAKDGRLSRTEAQRLARAVRNSLRNYVNLQYSYVREDFDGDPDGLAWAWLVEAKRQFEELLHAEYAERERRRGGKPKVGRTELWTSPLTLSTCPSRTRTML
jgi:hypothetical protein